jgi:hypothetical protein
MGLHQPLSRASLMCGNRAGCCNRRSSSAMHWPVSSAVELATERSTAFWLGFFRLGSVTLGMMGTVGFVLSSLWIVNVFVESAKSCKKLSATWIGSTLSRQLKWCQFLKFSGPKMLRLLSPDLGWQERTP